MVVCPGCQTSYADGAVRFCGRCGSSMEIALGSGRPGPAGDEADGWVGRVVDGRYRVAGRIGQGGMGVVYRVEHVRIGKSAALKVLHRELVGDREASKRFRREAEAVSQLTHPNIVQTFDFGQWEGAPYIVMEYVKGEDLGALLKRDGPQPWGRAARLFAQVASALGEAHEAGIIHRDLKPENIVCIRRRDGGEHAKVLDFGLAKLREREELAEITGRDHLVGTPYYMSPEQVRAEPLDARSDIYSLGATLYRVLTGEPPFQAATPVGVLTKHLTETLVAPSQRAPQLDIPAAADEIVIRAMARDRKDRYPSVAEVERDLVASLGGAMAIGGSTPTPVAVPIPAAIASAAPEAAPAPAAGGGGRMTDERADAPAEEERLRREDIDHFERGLGRRRLFGLMVVPVVLAAAALGGWLAFRDPADRPRAVEREPNNTAGTAAMLAKGAEVRGKIGRRLSATESDRDFWRIPLAEHGRRVNAELRGLPNMALVLELFDARGRRLAKIDGTAPGQTLALPSTTIGPGEAFLCVREVWVDGRPPTENVTDEYALVVTWSDAGR